MPGQDDGLVKPKVECGIHLSGLEQSLTDASL
jgi:hypothetical protein